VNVKGYQVVPSGKTCMLAHVGKKIHSNMVFAFPY
jgi:hypothetical protein